ncbi:MAG: hypothetical protein JRH20_23440 [Deltaproteobacteria bacterium]|nr:hypothetical protein [Deltaproteobacteria bacterium]
MKRIALVIAATILCSSVPAIAQVLNPAMSAQAKKKKIYRGSMVTYENVFSAYSLSEGAQQSYDPYYAMSLTFLPQIWLRDDMFVQARLGAEVELTLSESTDTKREPVLTDLSFTYMWTGAYTIPGAKIVISPNARMRFPTSKVSQARSMLFSIASGFSLTRSFKLHSGKFFNNLILNYGFRVEKPFNEYTTRQVDVACGNINRPECLHSGSRNINWRFSNAFTLRTNAHAKVILTLQVGLINDLLYEGGEMDKVLADGSVISIPATTNNHNALVQAAFDVTVPVAKWLYLSGGLMSFHNQLNPDSTRQFPLLNRDMMFYVDATLPIAPLVELFGG